MNNFICYYLILICKIKLTPLRATSISLLKDTIAQPSIKSTLPWPNSTKNKILDHTKPLVPLLSGEKAINFVQQPLITWPKGLVILKCNKTSHKSSSKSHILKHLLNYYILIKPNKSKKAQEFIYLISLTMIIPILLL